MTTKHKPGSIFKLNIGLAAFTLLIVGCSGTSTVSDAGGNAGSSGGVVTGVATPSKVSVVNTN